MEIPTKLEVQEITFPEKTFLIKRAVKSIDELPSFFKDVYGELYAAVEKQGLQATEAPYAIYFSIDEEKKETDLAAAVAVQGLKTVPEGYDMFKIPESKALQVHYKGAYENMHDAYNELDSYVGEHNLKKAWVLEQYFSDPQSEKDPSEWLTDIYYILK